MEDTKGMGDKTSQDSQYEHGENINADYLEEVGPREKKLMRKVDWRLLPILGALYAIALIDRVNVWDLSLHSEVFLGCAADFHRSPMPVLQAWTSSWNFSSETDTPSHSSSSSSRTSSSRLDKKASRPHSESNC